LLVASSQFVAVAAAVAELAVATAVAACVTPAMDGRYQAARRYVAVAVVAVVPVVDDPDLVEGQ